MDRNATSECFLEDPKFKRITVIDSKTLRAIICFCSSAVMCFPLKVKLSQLVPYHLLLGIGLSCF